jgi:hypothetical protein
MGGAHSMHGEMRNITKLLLEGLKGIDCEYLGVGGTIILRWIVWK